MEPKQTKNTKNSKISTTGNLSSFDKQIMRGLGVVALATIAMTLIPEDAFAQSNNGSSLDFLTSFLTEITNVIKKEGRIALEVLAAGAGAWYGAKSGSWPPVLVGGTSAGMIEMLFTIIK